MNLNRREFIAKTGISAAGLTAAGFLPRAFVAEPAATGGVAVICDPADAVVAAAPVRWAAEQLRQALAARGFNVKMCSRLDEAGPADTCIVASGPASTMARDAGVHAAADSEALAIGPGRLGQRQVLVANGGGVRGLVYALTELADDVCSVP